MFWGRVLLTANPLNANTLFLEVTRPDEDTVLKTAAVKNRCGFESHGFRLRAGERQESGAGRRLTSSLRTEVSSLVWERFHTGGCNPSAFNCVVVGERCDSLRSHFCKHKRLWCNGSTADSKPVSQGSNPWGRAWKLEGWSFKFEKTDFDFSCRWSSGLRSTRWLQR